MDQYYNYGGYPNGYPPQPYAYNNNVGMMNNYGEAMASPYSPFMNPPIPPMPNLPESQLENVYVSADGVVHGATEGPIQYTSVAKQLAGSGYMNQPMMDPYANPYQPPAPPVNPYQPQMQPQAGYYQQQPPMNPAYQQQQPVAPQPQNDAGYNPFSQYNVQQQQVQMNPYQPPAPPMNPYQHQMQQQNGYYQQPPINPYQPQNINIGGYGYNNPYYAQNTFDYQYRMMLNNEEYGGYVIPGFDPFECLKDAVFTDEEKSLINAHTPIGYGYNGAPMYTREQQMEYNRIYEDAREKVVDFWTQLSVAAHRGSGEENIDEMEIRSHYDPTMWVQPQPKNITSYTADELELQREYTKVYQTQIVHNIYNSLPKQYEYIDRKRAEGYARIKESHDKILGIRPGDDIDLKTYLSKAGSLYVDAITRDVRRLAHDGSIKYARSHYKNMFAKPGAGPLDPAFIDEDYVPMEKRLKEEYIMSKLKPKTIQLNENGEISIKPMPTRSTRSPDEDRALFLKSAMRGQGPSGR